MNIIPIVLTRISLKTMHIWAKVALGWVFGHKGGTGMGTWAERWHVDGLKYILHKSYMSRFVLHDFVLKCIKSSTFHIAAHIAWLLFSYRSTYCMTFGFMSQHILPWLLFWWRTVVSAISGYVRYFIDMKFA